MSCPDHTVKLDVLLPDGLVPLKLDTRRVEVRGPRGPLAGALDQARLAVGDTVVAHDPRSGATAVYEVGACPDRRHRPVQVSVVAGAAADLVELLAASGARGRAGRRVQEHPLFGEAARGVRASLPGAGDRDVAALLAVGVGPSAVHAYVSSGAVSVAEVRRLRRSRVAPDQLRSWRLLDPGMEVRSMQRAHGAGLTPERVVGYAGALLGVELGTSVADVARLVDESGATTGVRRPGSFPLEYLWSGPAPVARFLHQIGVSPRMLERGVAAEEGLDGQGAYLSKLARAVRGTPDVSVQLLDYTLLRYRSDRQSDVPLSVDDRTLVGEALGGLRRGLSVPAAVRGAVAATLEANAGTGVATTGHVVANAVALSAFTNSQPVGAALWAELVRSGSGSLRGGRDRAWQDVKNVVQSVLREGSCPHMTQDLGAKGLVAFYAAGSSGLAGMSAAQRQQVRHGYLLHPDGACTPACGHAGRGHGLSIVLEGAERELLRPFGVHGDDGVRSSEFVCATCHLHKNLSLRSGSDPASCVDCM